MLLEQPQEHLAATNKTKPNQHHIWILSNVMPLFSSISKEKQSKIIWALEERGQPTSTIQLDKQEILFRWMSMTTESVGNSMKLDQSVSC